MTLPQMRLFLKEGEKLTRLRLVQQARVMRAVEHADSDDFESLLDRLER